MWLWASLVGHKWSVVCEVVCCIGCCVGCLREVCGQVILLYVRVVFVALLGVGVCGMFKGLL